MVTALSAGAEAIVPVSDIPEALAWKNRLPEVLLAGERDGRRILADRTGGVDFDLGNSPREFVSERVGGRWIVATTSNGTRALRASVGARVVLPACLRNRRAVGRWLHSDTSEEWVLVCSGTLEDSAYEDVLGAGALVDFLWPMLTGFEVLDGARMARLVYLDAGAIWPGPCANTPGMVDGWRAWKSWRRISRFARRKTIWTWWLRWTEVG